MLQTLVIAEVVLFAVFSIILAFGLWSSFSRGTARTPTLDEAGSG